MESGAFGTLWCSCSSRKAGVSARLRRMIQPITTTTTLSQNGTRQPQDKSWSSGNREMGRNTAVARMEPGLCATKREAGDEGASVSRRVLERHRVGAGLLAGRGEALTQPQ